MDRHGITEKDWKLFRSKVVGWQEAYMERLNKEYIELLSSDEDESEKFWRLEKRIREDKKKAGVQLRMSRSEMFFNILSLVREGAIGSEDLVDFSEDLQEKVKYFAEEYFFEE